MMGTELLFEKDLLLRDTESGIYCRCAILRASQAFLVADLPHKMNLDIFQPLIGEDLELFIDAWWDLKKGFDDDYAPFARMYIFSGDCLELGKEIPFGMTSLQGFIVGSLDGENDVVPIKLSPADYVAQNDLVFVKYRHTTMRNGRRPIH